MVKLGTNIVALIVGNTSSDESSLPAIRYCTPACTCSHPAGDHCPGSRPVWKGGRISGMLHLSYNASSGYMASKDPSQSRVKAVHHLSVCRGASWITVYCPTCHQTVQSTGMNGSTSTRLIQSSESECQNTVMAGHCHALTFMSASRFSRSACVLRAGTLAFTRVLIHRSSWSLTSSHLTVPRPSPTGIQLS